MRALLLAVLLTVLASGCCTGPSPYLSARSPVLADPTWAGVDPAYRAVTTSGYRRPCYIPYRPTGSTALP